jgi:hypothetical protein
MPNQTFHTGGYFDELRSLRQPFNHGDEKEPTVLFPLPVGPIRLG